MVRYVCVLAGLVGLILAAGPTTQPTRPYTGKVADLGVDPANIGAKWRQRASIVVEDRGSPPKVAREQESVLEDMLQLMDNEAVRAVADFQYGTADQKAFDTITLRIYVFESKEEARTWWQRTFRYHRWEERYRLVDGYGDEAVDKLRSHTRIVRQGNVVFSSTQTIGWDASHRVLGLICEKLRSICGGSEPTARPEGDPAEE